MSEPVTARAQTDYMDTGFRPGLPGSTRPAKQFPPLRRKGERDPQEVQVERRAKILTPRYVHAEVNIYREKMVDLKVGETVEIGPLSERVRSLIWYAAMTMGIRVSTRNSGSGVWTIQRIE